MHVPGPPVVPVAPTQSAVEVNARENLGMVRAIALTSVGVIVLFSYFFHIDYFPLFDLQSASSYLFAVTYVMAILLIVLALTLLVPYFFIGTSLKTRKTAGGEERLAKTIIGWMGFGMLSLSGLSGFVLLALWLKWNISWGLLMALAFSLLLCALRTHVRVRKIKRNYSGSIIKLWQTKSVRKLFASQLDIAALSTVLQLIPLSVLLLMFSRASGVAKDDYVAFLAVSIQCAMLIAVVGAIMLHVALIPRKRRYWWVALSVFFALPLILNAVSGATGMLPMTIAHVTKIGNFRAEKLILSPKSCGSIALILGVVCDEKTSPSIQLCNVHIMSRIGPETYVRIADRTAGEDGKFSVRRIFLPTSEISSVQVNFAIKALHLDLIDHDLGGRSSAC